MELERAIRLINMMIDRMVEDAGGHSREVIERLLDMGFSSEELVEDFHFPHGDVAGIQSDSHQNTAEGGEACD